MQLTSELSSKTCSCRKHDLRCTDMLSSKTCSCRKHDLCCTDMCSLCDEICENRNLNVMTKNNGEDDDESLNL